MDDLVEAAPESVVARVEGDGFYARLSPQPDVRWSVVGALALGWAGCAAALAWWLGRGDPVLTKLLFGSLAIFGLMLYGFHYGRALMPVEVVASGDTVFFAGERLPAAAVGALVAADGSLVARSPEGGELGRIDGIGPKAGGWVCQAFERWRGDTA